MNNPRAILGSVFSPTHHVCLERLLRTCMSWLCATLIPLATVAPVQAAQPTSFEQVTQQLDPGGTLYVYISTARCLQDLSGKVDKLRDEFLPIVREAVPDTTPIAQGFDLVSGLIRRSGLESLRGFGMSGLEIGDGLYRTKFFAHRSPDEAVGYGGKLFGRSPHPLQGLDLLPLDTVYAAFHDLDAQGLWSALEREVNGSGFAELGEGLVDLREALEEAAGMPIDELLGSLKGQFGVVVTLNEDNQVPIPLPTGSEIRIAEPRLAMVLKVTNDALFDRLEDLMNDNPDFERADTGNLRSRTLPVPIPIPMPLRLTVARFEDNLVVATSDTLVQQMVEVLDKKQPGLQSSPTFQRLAAGMELQGNGFGYLDKGLGELIFKVQRATIEAQTAMSGDTGSAEIAIVGWLQGLMRSVMLVEEFSVSANTVEGWKVVAQGNREPAQTILTVAGIAPVSIMAGIALPALAKSKTKAQSISCVNNLKQLGLGVRIYAVDHQDVFPPDIVSMKDELSTPRVLFCPADPDVPSPLPSSWDDLDIDTISYEYLHPGAKEVDLVPDEILFRCRYHGHTCRADGSVWQEGRR